MFKVFPTTTPHHISSPFARFFFFKFSYKWDKRQLGFPLARPPLHKTHVRAVRSRTGISELTEIYWAHLPFVDRTNALLRDEKSLWNFLNCQNLWGLLPRIFFLHSFKLPLNPAHCKNLCPWWSQFLQEANHYYFNFTPERPKKIYDK